MQYVLLLRGLLVVTGLLLVVWAVRRRALFSLIRGTPVVNAVDAGPGDRVAVRGTIEPVADDVLVETELDDDDAVVTAWQTEEHRTHYFGVKQGYSEWEDVSAGYRSTPFYVRDDTGRVLVDPDASVRNEPSGVATTGTLGNSVTDGETIVSFSSFEEHTPKSFDVTAAEAAGASGQQQTVELPFMAGPEDGEREHEEATLDPGDEVYVLGTVSRTDADVDTGARSERCFDANAGGPFVLSDRPRTELLVHAGFAFPVAAIGVGLIAIAALGF